MLQKMRRQDTDLSPVPPNVIGNHRNEPLAHRNETRTKGTNDIRKEKTFRGYFSQKSIILTLPL